MMMSTLSTPLEAAHIEGSSVREHQAIRGQPLVPGVEHGVQHGLVKEAVAHPLGDDDVHLVHPLGQADLLHLAPDDSHHVIQLVVPHDLLGVVHNRAHVNSNHHLSTSLGSKHGENSCSTSDIKNNLALEEMLVVPH